MIKIITVDNNRIFSTALKDIIEKFDNTQVIAQYYNGQEIIDYCTKCIEFPDIILMDVQMPIVDGIDATKWILNKYPYIKIIVFTMHETDHIIKNMVNTGVKSYLTKDITPKELEEAIIETYTKGHYNSKQIINLNLHINKN